MHNIKTIPLWLKLLGVALGWQLAMTLLGVFLDHRYSVNDPATITPLSHTTYWDGGWFLSIIIGNGYEINGAAPVFYPLFPLAVTIVQTASFHLLSITAAALVINTLALWAAIFALAQIVEYFADKKYRWLAIGLFLASPAAIFLHMFYAEALFCALAFWAYLFALRRQWIYMALCLSLLATVKIPALLVIGLCGLEFARAHEWSIRKILNRNLLSFAIVPLGFLSYGLYLQRLRGDFLGMFHGYNYTTDWAYHVFNPNFILPILRALKTSILLFLGRAENNDLALTHSLLPFTGLALLALASLYVIIFVRGRTLPLGIAGLTSIVFFCINSNTVSVHRYLLASLILYLVPVILVQRYKKLYIVALAAMLAGCLLQLILYVFFVSNRFAG